MLADTICRVAERQHVTNNVLWLKLEERFRPAICRADFPIQIGRRLQLFIRRLQFLASPARTVEPPPAVAGGAWRRQT